MPPASANLFDLILQGGWAMIPLGLCSVVMFYLLFFCYRETRRNRFVPPAVQHQVSEYMKARDVAAASSLLAGVDSVLSRVFVPALGRLREDRENLNLAKAEETLVEKLDAEESNSGQWVNYLNVVAGIAPMIGLLGTVSGMISAFQTIGQGGMGKPELLAADIGEALITTATGLVIGIPAMIGYFYMRNRLTSRITETHQAATELLDELDA